MVLKSALTEPQDELSQNILAELRQRKGKVPVKLLMRKFSGQNVDRVLARLESLEIVEIEEHLAKQRRKKDDLYFATTHTPTADSIKFDLTEEQRIALQTITDRINSGGFETFLMFGVTGSGKTEVYLRAMERARRARPPQPYINSGNILDTAIVGSSQCAFSRSGSACCIARLPARNAGRNGGGRCAARSMSSSARVRRYSRRLRISGLIIVDEEHDPSYKQEEGCATTAAMSRSCAASCRTVR